MQLGEQVYKSNCVMCHQSDGSGMPPAVPALRGDKIVTGPLVIQLHKVIFGVKNTAMQAFGEQLDNAEIAAVITFTRNSWSNEKAGKFAGGLAQPAQVAEARKW
jgi:cytochrome c oxidase subunit 2